MKMIFDVYRQMKVVYIKFIEFGCYRGSEMKYYRLTESGNIEAPVS